MGFLMFFSILWGAGNIACRNGTKTSSLGTKISHLIYRLVTASADGTARVYNTMTGACVSILVGHEGEISKVTKLMRPELRHDMPQTKPARLARFLWDTTARFSQDLLAY